MELFVLERGDSPLLINVPHAGTYLPEGIAARLSEAGAGLPDTDWFVDELYAFATDLGAGLMAATHSRYVVDLNRPPDDAALYAGRTTGLVPMETFAGDPLYTPEGAPGGDEVAGRREAYWQPYHDALDAELRRIRKRFGHAVLLDAHSILGEVPDLFDGRLPDLNLGSHGGRSAVPALVHLSMRHFESAGALTSVLDGRFKGGYNTRHYGRPADGCHALQLEMAQRVYMDEVPPARNPGKASRTRMLLEAWVEALMGWRPDS